MAESLTQVREAKFSAPAWNLAFLFCESVLQYSKLAWDELGSQNCPRSEGNRTGMAAAQAQTKV
jgi:hypothetical protein